MAAHTIGLTAEFEAFIAARLQSGTYKNAGEVFAAAMEALQREECDDESQAGCAERGA